MILEKFPPIVRDLARKHMLATDYDEKVKAYRECWALMSTLPPLKIKSCKDPVHPCTVCRHSDECWEIMEVEKAFGVVVREKMREMNLESNIFS